MSQKPSIGRVVHYVLAERDSQVSFGRTRPAIIVALIDDGSKEGLVNLQVFTNGGIDQLPPVQHCKDIMHDESAAQGTWHWPPYVAPAPEQKIDLSKMSNAKLEAATAILKAKAEASRPTPKNYEEQLKLEAADAEAATEPFPVALPPPAFQKDPVVAARPTEPFPIEEDETEP